MKYVVTGSAGNISKPLTEFLLEGGHEVILVSRKLSNIQELVDRGATPAIGDMRDVTFLTEQLKGADGAYLMLPPMWDEHDQKAASVKYAEGFKEAIRATGVKQIVFLSSWGADRLDDAGAISGMGRAEVVLNGLTDTNVLHLRAGYFYTNFFLSVDLIKTAGHMGNMYEVPQGYFPLVDPVDIAKAAVEGLTKGTKGHSYRYVVSDQSGTDEVAKVIGAEIGIPDLKWARFSPEDFHAVLVQYGFVPGAADSYVEMFKTLDKGGLVAHYKESDNTYSGTSLEQFAKRFAAVYKK